jgi:hypothetical protein
MAGLPADLEALPPPALPRMPPGPRLLLGLALLPLVGLLLAGAGLDAAGEPCAPVETVSYSSGARGVGGGCGVRDAAAKAAPAIGTGLAAVSIAWVDGQAGPRRRWLLALQVGLAGLGLAMALLASFLGWPAWLGLAGAAVPMAILAALAFVRTLVGQRARPAAAGAA